MKGIGEKISNWWDGNKSWAAPVAVGGLVALGVTAVVLSGGAALPALPALALLANGGVATKPTTALIGEYPGAQSNPEIVAPQSILRQTFRQELNGGVSNEEVINAIYAMGERVVRAINDKDSNMYLDGVKVNKEMKSLEEQYNRVYAR